VRREVASVLMHACANLMRHAACAVVVVVVV
jgi:hypothetical protein